MTNKNLHEMVEELVDVLEGRRPPTPELLANPRFLALRDYWNGTSPPPAAPPDKPLLDRL